MASRENPRPMEKGGREWPSLAARNRWAAACMRTRHRVEGAKTRVTKGVRRRPVGWAEVPHEAGVSCLWSGRSAHVGREFESPLLHMV